MAFGERSWVRRKKFQNKVFLRQNREGGGDDQEKYKKKKKNRGGERERVGAVCM